jgi:6,7-dimethyl-8-ribityllumazine synthase
MTPIFTGDLAGKGHSFGVVVSRFSKTRLGGKTLGEVLLEGCLARLREAGVAENDIAVVWVPGAFELPLAAQRLIEAHTDRGRTVDAVIALGAVVRGETPHFDYVSGEAARGVAAVARETNVPVLFGVLTCDTAEQAIARCGGKAGHKGIEAAEAALEAASVFQRVAKWKPQSAESQS